MSETLQLPEEEKKVEKLDGPEFSVRDYFLHPCMKPSTPEHELSCRLNNADARRSRRGSPHVSFVPPKISFEMLKLSLPSEMPEMKVRLHGHFLTYFDTGHSLAELTKLAQILPEFQQDYDKSAYYSMTHRDEEMIRASAHWKAKEQPTFRQMLLWPAYPRWSVSSALLCSKLCRPFAKRHHMSLRSVVMAMLLYHRVKQEQNKKGYMFLQPGVVVSSTRIGDKYAALSYDSIRITLMLHDGKAGRPWEFEYPTGLALERA